jgi:hypothetical protein
MAMGKRKRHAKQASMWVAINDLPRSAEHPLHTQLNQVSARMTSTRTSNSSASDSTRPMAGQGCRQGGTSGCC